jgi:hypothetical protein
MVRTVRWIALFVIAAGLLAACANGSDDDGVASLGGDAATGATGTTGAAEDPEEALQAFAECMREHGVEDFPDPQIGEDGGIQIGAPAGGGLGDADRQTLDAAMEACQDLLPQDLGPGEEGPSAEDQAALEDAMLAYARCMRDHGIDFPDPEFSDHGVIQRGGVFDPSDPAFQEADEACNHFLDDAGINFGEAPND